jgi:hypothetical protein
MGSLGRKIHLELLYGFTNHRLPITTSLVRHPSPAVAGRSSLVHLIISVLPIADHSF